MTEWGNTISRSTGSGDPVTEPRRAAADPPGGPRERVADESRADNPVPDVPAPVPDARVLDAAVHDTAVPDDRVSDERLLADAASGDGDAFAALFQRHARQLRATALRTIRDCTDAEDCLQDAMLRAFQLSPTFRGDCKVGSWLHRIVVNACLDRARRNQVRTSLPMPDDLSGLASDEGRAAEELDRRLSVEAALRMLPEDQRAAVVAVDMHGLSITQAAELLGVAPGTVKSRRARARVRLERLLR